MKRSRGRIILYSLAAIAGVQLLLFSYIKQAFCGELAAAMSIPSAGRDGTDGTSSCTMRDTLHSAHLFLHQSLNAANSRTFDERGPKRQSVRGEEEKWEQVHEGDGGGRRRRGLMSGGIGSTPPKCISKCAKCTPCKPVRVPIQPGRTKVSLMEYYPEAWRCKCNNKLYLP